MESCFQINFTKEGCTSHRIERMQWPIAFVLIVSNGILVLAQAATFDYVNWYSQCFWQQMFPRDWNLISSDKETLNLWFVAVTKSSADWRPWFWKKLSAIKMSLVNIHQNAAKVNYARCWCWWGDWMGLVREWYGQGHKECSWMLGKLLRMIGRNTLLDRPCW